MRGGIDGDYDKAYAIWKGYRGATELEYIEMNRLISIALLKQIPKRPNETEAYPHRLYCPDCSWTFWFNKENADADMYKYCPECGQRIDME